MLYWLRFWYREKSWHRGWQDGKSGKTQSAPFWLLRRFYRAGFRDGRKPPNLSEAELSFNSKFSVLASTYPEDYEIFPSSYWPPLPPPPCGAEASKDDAEHEISHAALIILPCWIFHKNDVDPWPSTMHGHHNERPLKLDAITGQIFSIHTRKHVQTLRPRELRRIQATLKGSKDFKERASALFA